MIFIIQGRVVQFVQLCERCAQGISMDATIIFIIIFTRWPSVGCKPWTHPGSLNWWRIWGLLGNARFTLVHFKDINGQIFISLYLPASHWSKIKIFWLFQFSRQGALLSRLPSYCKIKDNLPSMNKILRLMHIARLTFFLMEWRFFKKIPFQQSNGDQGGHSRCSGFWKVELWKPFAKIVVPSTVLLWQGGWVLCLYLLKSFW